MEYKTMFDHKKSNYCHRVIINEQKYYTSDTARMILSNFKAFLQENPAYQTTKPYLIQCVYHDNQLYYNRKDLLRLLNFEKKYKQS